MPKARTKFALNTNFTGFRGLSVSGLEGLRSSVAFDPATLFGVSDTGWFYDNSDFSTLFQDSAGTTPVTAVGQPVGLQLDKSKGLVLGPELVTNGDFSAGDTGWTEQDLNGGVSGYPTFTGGVLTIARGTGTNQSRAYQSFSTTVGATYRIYAEYSRLSGTRNVAFFKADDVSTYPNLIGVLGSGSSGVFEFTFVATSTTTYILPGLDPSTSIATVAEIDNISVRELPGNHRFQSTALSRPTLRQDSNGLYYLEYDGTSDSLATASFAWGTDKATVVAGVRKLSDAASGMVVEFSVFDTNPGMFLLLAPGSSGLNSYRFGSRGSAAFSGVTDTAQTSGANFPAPDTAVLSGLGDIAGDSQILRRNSVQVGINTVFNQGTGNFGTYQTFFGARAGTSLYFNGREYSQFGINRLLTADELAKIEAYTAGRTGVTL